MVGTRITDQTSRALVAQQKLYFDRGGTCREEGKLSIHDPVLKFFPDLAPAQPSENLKGMRVKDLLTMATGHQDEPPVRDSSEWTKTFLNFPVPHKPGTHFKYNTPATYMQSAIVQKFTGQKVVDYLTLDCSNRWVSKNPSGTKALKECLSVAMACT